MLRFEPKIFGDLDKRRAAIMGALLAELGEIADALVTHPAKSLSFRMADFASFGERASAASGLHDCRAVHDANWRRRRSLRECEVFRRDLCVCGISGGCGALGRDAATFRRALPDR